MDLHGMASGMIGTVNPFEDVTVKVSTGYTTDDAGRRVPTYATPATISAQRQSLTYKDLQQISGLNINGDKAALYIEGSYDAVVRSESKGGDLFTLTDGSIWLVVQVLEKFPDWCKVAIVRQNS